MKGHNKNTNYTKGENLEMQITSAKEKEMHSL